MLEKKGTNGTLLMNHKVDDGNETTLSCSHCPIVGGTAMISCKERKDPSPSIVAHDVKTVFRGILSYDPLPLTD